MSTKNKSIDSEERNNVTLGHTAANPLDNCAHENNTYRLHTSHNSTVSNESDLSLLSLSLEKELESSGNAIDIDELPAFEIRLISPLGRTPSPIDSEDIETPTRPSASTNEKVTPNHCLNNPEFVALRDINAQISPPSDNEEIESSLSRTSSLETIYEGVFLKTPPRQCLNLQNRSRTNLLEKVALNRYNLGKENQSPLSKSEMQPFRRTSIDFRCAPDQSARDECLDFS